jgi:hypothetical protein
MLDFRFFRGTDSDINHYLVVAKVMKKLLASTRATQKYGVDRFNLKKLNETEVREQYQVTVSNTFAVFGELRLTL